MVANIAYAETSADWLLHLDADEFLVDAGGMLGELAAVPDAALGLRVPVRERVWTNAPTQIFDGAFKLPVPGKLGLDGLLYGERSKYMQRGLTGHTRGKTFCRTGRDLVMSIHGPRDPEKLALMEAQAMHLLHFDGLTPFHWLLKRLKYAALPHAEVKKQTDHYRWNQISALQAMESLEDARRFQEELTLLDEAQVTQLSQLKLLTGADAFSPNAALSRYGFDEVSLDVDVFDRRLKRRDRDFVEAIGWSD